MTELHRITIDPEQCGGRPCVRGLRVRVSDILNLLASGATREEILADYPYLEAGDITAALEYAARQSDDPILSVACKPESHPNQDDSADWQEFFHSVPPVPDDFMAECAMKDQPNKKPRNIGEEILSGLRELKRGKYGRVITVTAGKAARPSPKSAG